MGPGEEWNKRPWLNGTVADERPAAVGEESELSGDTSCYSQTKQQTHQLWIQFTRSTRSKYNDILDFTICIELNKLNDLRN
jgi:hypothetical protein